MMVESEETRLEGLALRFDLRLPRVFIRRVLGISKGGDSLTQTPVPLFDNLHGEKAS